MLRMPVRPPILWQLSAALLLFALWGCDRTESVRPAYRNLTEAVYASGMLRPIDLLEIGPSVPGTIVEILVSVGDTVEAGQALARLRSESAAASADALRKEIQQAERNANPNGPLLRSLLDEWRNLKTKADLDSAEFARLNRLFNQGATTRSRWEQFKTGAELSARAAEIARSRYENQRQQLQTGLEAMRQQLRALEAGLAEFSIRSPKRGRVHEVRRKAGEWIGPPASAFSVGSIGPMIAEIYVDEADALRMRPGLKTLVRPEGMTGKPSIGKIIKVYPAVEASSRTLKVEVELEESFHLSGLSLEANIIVQEHGRVLSVPRGYLIAGDSLVVDRGSGPQRVSVRTGVRDLNYVEIIEGVDTSTQILMPQ